MAYVKLPSWLELFSNSKIHTTEDAFWKEQTLRFGFESSTTEPWKNYFFARLFEYSLKKVDWEVAKLKASEKKFWLEHGQHIERLEIVSSSIRPEDFVTVVRWLPNLKMLHLAKCNQLLHHTGELLTTLDTLHTLELRDIHMVSKKVLEYFPDSIKTLVFKQCRSICPEFFEKLPSLQQLHSLLIQHCPTLDACLFGKFPQELVELDLTSSGKVLQEDSLALLPRGLKILKLNRWDRCSSRELNYLPQKLHTLELEGWNLTSKAFERLSELPLAHLNVAATSCDDLTEALSYVPCHIRSLNLSQNYLKCQDFQKLSRFHELEKLQVEYAQAFGSDLSQETILFPEQLKELVLTCSGPFAKSTLQRLRTLTSLKKLSLSGCDIENSDLGWLPQGIEELHLALCNQLTDFGIARLQNQQKLISLNLDGCEQVRGSCLSTFSSELKRLSLQGCSRLSGKSFSTLPTALEQLLLDHCTLITTDDLSSLPASLQVLSLSGCSSITNEAIDFFMDLPILHTISLQGCPCITSQAIEKCMRRKFEGTIMIEDCIELHPPVSMLKKLTSFKAKLIERFTK